jgi:glycosyltransferase 2 family protein
LAYLIGDILSNAPSFFSRLRDKILWILGLSVAVYISVAVWMGGGELLDTLKSFNFIYLVPIFAAVLSNYILRFFKWHYYLNVCRIELPIKESIVIFLSAFSMAVTPGKVGELLKAQLVKDRTGTPRRKTIPIVLAERITDLLALLVISGLGVLTLPLPETVEGISVRAILWIGAIVPFALLVILMTPALRASCIHVVGKLPVLGKHAEKLEHSLAAISILITPFRLVAMTLLSVLSWGGECLAFYLVLRGLGGAVEIWQVAFIYAFSTIAGIFTPGGLGPTDGFLVALPILMMRIPKATAGVAMGLIRAATLWFAVLLGLGALFYFAKVYSISDGELDNLNEEEKDGGRCPPY